MKKRKGTIYQIEGKWVVEFDNGMSDILISRCSMTVESGDVVWMDKYGSIEKDNRERERLSNKIDDLMDELWEN